MLVINGPLMPVVLRWTGLMRTTTEQAVMLEKDSCASVPNWLKKILKAAASTEDHLRGGLKF
eukprot:4013451-Amphidinium_carterae.1